MPTSITVFPIPVSTVTLVGIEGSGSLGIVALSTDQVLSVSTDALTGQLGSVAVQGVISPSILTIPNFSITETSTHDMSQYINDPQTLITNSQIIGIDTNVATYSHATLLLTGVAVGSMTNVQLEVTY